MSKSLKCTNCGRTHIVSATEEWGKAFLGFAAGAGVYCVGLPFAALLGNSSAGKHAEKVITRGAKMTMKKIGTVKCPYCGGELK